MDKYHHSINVKCSKELSERQEKDQEQYFSLKRRSNGGECTATKLRPSLYRVSFQKKEVMERVLNQKDHKMKSEGELIEFTLQENEEAQDQAHLASAFSEKESDDVVEELEMSGSSGHTVLTSFVPLDSNFRYLVVKDKIDDIICKSFPSLQVHCENRELKLTGKADLPQARDMIKNILSSVRKRKIEISQAKAGFLASRKSNEISDKIFDISAEGHVILDNSRGFCLYAPSESLLDQAESALQQRLQMDQIPINANERDIILLEPWKNMLDNLKSNSYIDIRQEHNYSGDLTLSFVGFTEEVKQAVKKCKDHLCQRASIKEEFYLEHHTVVEHLQHLLKSFQIGQLPATVQILKSPGQTFTAIGPREEVDKCKHVIEKLKEKLNVNHLFIKKHGARHFFNSEGKQVLGKLLGQFNCHVYICDSETEINRAEGMGNASNKSVIEDDSNLTKELKMKEGTSFHKITHQEQTSGSGKRDKSSKEKQEPVLTLVLSYGQLENKKADVLVGPLLSTNPVLEAMKVSKDLKQKGGIKFSNLFTALLNCRATLPAGSLLEMSVSGDSYSLNCDITIFIVCHPWDGPDGLSVKALKKGVSHTLGICNSRNMRSVTMSVIGPGKKLGFPDETAAKIIGNEVKSFVEKEPNTTLKIIEIVIHPENQMCYFVYRETLLEMNLGDQIALCNEDGGPFQKLSVNEHYQEKIGNLSMVVTYNDITKESTDAIVNSTNFSQWGKESVAHAIFTAAGQNIIQEAKQGTPINGLVMTGSGALKCKLIIHCDCVYRTENVANLVKNILQKCESTGLQSVAIPAIGTGECKLNPEIVAHVMVDAIASIAKNRNLTSLTCVRLVTFNPYIYYIFRAELKRRFRSVQESFWSPLDLLSSRLRHQRLPENDAISDIPVIQHPIPVPASAWLVIVTDKSVNVNAIKLCLKEEFDKQYREEKIEQSLLKSFSVEEIQNVFSVVNGKPEVKMIMDKPKNCIFLKGCEKDVGEVAIKVQANLTAIIAARLQKVTREQAGLLIQWGYLDAEASKPFTVEASQLLEDKYLAEKKGVVEVKIENGKQAKVNLETMKASLDGARSEVNVVRRDLKAEHNCPLHWNDMNGQLFKVVELNPNSEEYKKVKANFNRTVKRPIKKTSTEVDIWFYMNCEKNKIERIQNSFQHTAYILRKSYITEKNGPDNVNEQNLFHGTAPQNCHSINYSGFNRNFAGQNAAAFGNGVYFAVEASYSADQTYSCPDPNTGERFMYQVKVLVGRHTKGQKDMKTPPCRTVNDPFDHYDSLANENKHPNMFVVFHDSQVYPEYLITFN